MRKVLINHEVKRFYCWRWCRWQSFKKFGYCCENGCQRMMAPPELHWKAGYLGGLLVPAGPG